MIYSLISAIASVLAGVRTIKKVYAYPIGETTRIEKYPAVIFLQDSFENSFESTRENAKTYRFKLWVVINCETDDMEAIWTSALPKAMDSVIAAFDAAWSGGTTQDGHRITYVLNAGSTSLATGPDGREAFAELTLDIRALTGV